MADRWQKSRQMLAQARESLSGGVSSPFRAMAPVPLYFEDGEGSHLRDVDGNNYIDYTLAWGPVILGHKHPKLVEAVSRQAAMPHIYGAQHALEPEVATQVQRAVPCAERVAFTSSGSEAVQLALRLARGFSGRQKVLKFEGHYHGWMDSVLLGYRAPLDGLGSRGQVANAPDNVIIAPWNDAGAVERLFAERGNEIAAVITEPVLCNTGCIMPAPGFLAALREITTRHRAVLIFDEIITGFRMALGGAQQVFGVTPDLATFGKAIAGGLAMSAVAGRKDIMDMMHGGGVVFGGTFNGNPLSLAAAKATLEVLSDPAHLERANRLGRRLMDGIAAIAARRGVTLEVHGFGAAFGVHMEDRPAYIMRMLERGIYLLPDGRVYVSTAHSDADVDQTLEAMDASIV